MKTRVPILRSTLILIWTCGPSIEDPLDLHVQNWTHTPENCEENIDAPIQIVKYNSTTYSLRQNKCIAYEAPFMFLFFSAHKALLFTTGAAEEEAIFPLYKTVKKISNDWSKEKGEISLIVAHSHKHGDHYVGDEQFISLSVRFI
jgi:hypothetical protein